MTGRKHQRLAGSCHCLLASYSLHLTLQFTPPVPLLSRPPRHSLHRWPTYAVFSCKLRASSSAFVPCDLCVQVCFMQVVEDAGLIRARHMLCAGACDYSAPYSHGKASRPSYARGWRASFLGIVYNMMTHALEAWRKAGADFTHAVVLMSVIDIMLRLAVIMMCGVTSVGFLVVA